MLAGLGRRLDELHVEHVRRGDEHHVHARIVDHAAPVVRPLLEAEGLDGVLDASWGRIGAGHQLGLEHAVGEQRPDPLQGATVGLAEPAEADQADSDAAAGAGPLGASGVLPHRV